MSQDSFYWNFQILIVISNFQRGFFKFRSVSVTLSFSVCSPVRQSVCSSVRLGICESLTIIECDRYLIILKTASRQTDRVATIKFLSYEKSPIDYFSFF